MRKQMIAAALIAATTSATANNYTDSLGHVIDNVVVTGTRNQTDVRHLPMTLSVVGRDDMDATKRLNMLPTLTEEVPGLFVTQRGLLGFGVSDGAAGGINLRGVSAGNGRMMVLIDGHPQYQGIFGHPIADSYQTMMADRVEVLHGPASVLYGSNAMGGVVNIVTRHMQTDGVATNIRLSGGSYGTTQAELTNRLKQGRFYSVVAAQYARTDNHRASMGFEQYGGYAKMGYEISTHWNAYADINLTHFNASYPGSTTTPVYGARQWVTRGVATAVVENHYGRTSGAISVYHNFGRHKINDGYEEGESPATTYFRSNDALTGVSLYQSASLFSGNRLTLGLDYQHIYGKAWNKVIATGEDQPAIGHEHENEVAAYLDIRQDVTPWLTLDAGLRLDHHSQTGTEWVPQGGLVFRVLKDAELKAMVSKGFRNPTIREMYFWRPANDELEPESMMNYELSWRQRLADGALSYGVNLFYIKGDNMIQTLQVDGRPRNVNTGEIENSGVELKWNWHIDNHWSISNNYSYLHMTNAVVGAPEWKAWLGARYAQGRWSANVGVQYIDGLYTQTSPEEKEHYIMLNATVDYKVCKAINLWCRGDNLLAQKYETIKGYPMPRATFMGGVDINF